MPGALNCSKHPDVARIYPMRIEDALDQQHFTPGQFEIMTILLERANELPAETIHALKPLASRGVILAVGDDVQLMPTPRVAAAS